jgi:hypothetical protein
MSERGYTARSGIQPGRHRADFEDGVVVFLIGMRFNAIWRIDQWLPVFLTMPRMLRELNQNRELGLLHDASWFGWRRVMVVQYWKDMDHLMRYATSRDNEHLPAWTAFNRRARSATSVGIWHEAYEVSPESSHIIYRNMPSFGMGKAAGVSEAADDAIA